MSRNTYVQDSWSIRNYVAAFAFYVFLVLAFVPGHNLINSIGCGGALTAVLLGGFGTKKRSHTCGV
jgi:hypothetical protein